MKLLFKARGCESRKWYEGLITHLNEETCHIEDKEQREWFCDPSTICQYKGFNDKNGKKFLMVIYVNIIMPREKMGLQ